MTVGGMGFIPERLLMMMMIPYGIIIFVVVIIIIVIIITYSSSSYYYWTRAFLPYCHSALHTNQESHPRGSCSAYSTPVCRR